MTSVFTDKVFDLSFLVIVQKVGLICCWWAVSSVLRFGCGQDVTDHSADIDLTLT